MTTLVGAKWWKVDFHTHSPASLDYGKSDSGLRDTKTARDWLLDYINVGVECVVLTDHNSGAWVDIVKSEADSLRTEGHVIHVFPGVEITANSNIHVLGIFDPSKTAADIEGLVGAAHFRGTRGDSDAVAEESAEKIIEEIIQSGGLAIPAHIDLKSGLCQSDSGHTIRQACKKAHALEIIHPENSASGTPLSKLTSLKTVPPSVIGSDAHHPSEVGRAFTWVKMGEPSIDGLRLALIDGKSSLIRSDDESSENPNATSNHILHSVRVTNAKYAGRSNPLDISFNPWLNSIIGGRGSGKSSVLEFVRIGMGRDRDLLQLDDSNEVKQSFVRFSQKAAGRDAEGVILDSTEVSCVYSKDGIFYSTQWSASDRSVSIFRYDGATWQQEEGNAHSRFPVKIFSQKQIFNLAKHPNALLRLIDESDDVGFQNWLMSWEEKKNKFSRLCEERRELNAKLSNKGTLLGQLSDVEQKISLIEKSGHAELLKKYQSQRAKRDAAIDSWEILLSQVNDIKTSVEEQSNSPINVSFLELENKAEASVAGKLLNINNHFDAVRGRILNDVQSIEKLIGEFYDWLGSSEFYQELGGIEGKYNKLVTELAEQGIDSPAEYESLLAVRGQLKQSLDEIGTIEFQIGELTKEIDNCYSGVVNARIELSVKRNEFIQRYLHGNNSIKIELEPFADLDATERSFRRLLGREDGAFSSDICDLEKNAGIINTLIELIKSERHDPDRGIEGLKSRAAVLHRFKTDLCNFGNGEVLGSNLGKRFMDFLSQLMPHMCDRANLWFPEDKLLVKYNDGNRFRDIAQGSAGQKASAILSFLLSHGNEPLILDQPEDDLDNGLITELIVTKIQENKSNRQIIIVTHNPNIVVNGDSEYVVALQDKGQIEVVASGALQEATVRKKVCEIMEGGEIALQKRYKRMFNV